MIVAWSLVHGYAMLLLDGRLKQPIAKFPPGANEMAFLPAILSAALPKFVLLRGRRQLSVIYGLLNLQRARLFDPIHSALDGPLVPRRFPQSTPLQRFQEPCEWQTRWQTSSSSYRRRIPHGGLSQG
jgi:hypothetical protein